MNPLAACESLLAEAEAILRAAAPTLASSLGAFFPGPLNGQSDAPEANLTIHLAGALVARSWLAYAEVTHGLLDARIDLLGISPDRTRFLAFEMKRQRDDRLSMSVDDEGRLRTFRIGHRLPAGRFGIERSTTCERCVRGIGVVAGMKWTPGSYRPSLERPIASADRLLSGGTVNFAPIELHSVSSNQWRGTYWLLARAVPCACPEATSEAT